MVLKASRDWRPCGDYRHFNAVTEADRYAIPHIHDFAARFFGVKIFSKVDFIRGYHQVFVAPEDIAKPLSLHCLIYLNLYGCFRFEECCSNDSETDG